MGSGGGGGERGPHPASLRGSEIGRVSGQGARPGAGRGGRCAGRFLFVRPRGARRRRRGAHDAFRRPRPGRVRHFGASWFYLGPKATRAACTATPSGATRTLLDLRQRQLGSGGHERREFGLRFSPELGFPARVAMPGPRFVSLVPRLRRSATGPANPATAARDPLWPAEHMLRSTTGSGRWVDRGGSRRGRGARCGRGRWREKQSSGDGNDHQPGETGEAQKPFSSRGAPGPLRPSLPSEPSRPSGRGPRRSGRRRWGSEGESRASPSAGEAGNRGGGVAHTIPAARKL